MRTQPSWVLAQPGPKPGRSQNEVCSALWLCSTKYPLVGKHRQTQFRFEGRQVAPLHEGGKRDFKDRLKECPDFVAAVSMDVALYARRWRLQLVGPDCCRELKMRERRGKIWRLHWFVRLWLEYKWIQYIHIHTVSLKEWLDGSLSIASNFLRAIDRQMTWLLKQCCACWSVYLRLISFLTYWAWANAVYEARKLRSQVSRFIFNIVVLVFVVGVLWCCKCKKQKMLGLCSAGKIFYSTHSTKEPTVSPF